MPVIGMFGARVEVDSQGAKDVGNNLGVQLTATATQCEFVWISAPSANHTAGANTSNILIGTDATDQKTGGVTLVNTDYDGIVFPITDASLIYLDGFTSGDGVEYIIFKAA